MKKLRVGFIVDDLKPSANVAELIGFVSNDELFDAPVIISVPLKNYSGSFFY